MFAKQYLLQVQKNRKMLVDKKERIDRIKELAISAPSIKYDEKIKSSNASGSVIDRSVCKYIDFEQEFQAFVYKCMQKGARGNCCTGTVTDE